MAYGVSLNVYNEFNILLPEQDKLLPNANEKESDDCKKNTDVL